MKIHRIRIIRYIRTAEETTVEVEAETRAAALRLAEERYMEGEYDGVADIEWSEDADAYDAYEHEMKVEED